MITLSDTILLDEMLKRKVSQNEAFEFFDHLEGVEPQEIWGLWKGDELQTGHPLEGLLKTANWYGKRFIDEEHVHPLLCERENGNLFSVNPGMIPIAIPLTKVPKNILSTSLKVFRPLIKTNKSSARLRKVEFRGKISSAMIYDQKGIIDIFRKVNENTLLGIMDIKNIPTDKCYFFVLKRVKEDIPL